MSKTCLCTGSALAFVYTRPFRSYIFISEKEREFRTRVKEHVRYIENCNVCQATGQHLCKSDHNITHFSITILEKVNTSDTIYIEERETEWIRKFNCKHCGISSTPVFQISRFTKVSLDTTFIWFIAVIK